MKKYSFIILIMFCLSLMFFPFGKAQTTNINIYYVTTAVDANGAESTYSNQAVCGYTASKFHCTLSWVASTSTVAGYNIYKSNTTGGPYIKVNTSLITLLTYTDTYTFPNPPTGLVGVTN